MKKQNFIVVVTILSLFTSLIFTQELKADKKSKSENIQDEKRKKKIEELTETMVRNDTDKLFDIKVIPAKWAKESAVILNQRINYIFGEQFTTTISRRRFLLNDKSAVEEFSKIYTELNLDDYENNRLVVRVIKSDGTQKIINANYAIKEKKGNIPSVFKQYITVEEEYFKVAIPDLEIGDIVDYTTEHDQRALSITIPPYTCLNMSSTLASSVPILRQTIDIEISKDHNIVYNTYNGAPKFKFEEGEKGIKFYTLLDSNRDKKKVEKWTMNQRELPTVKIHVSALASLAGKASSKNIDLSREFIRKDREVNVTVDKEFIKEKMANIFTKGTKYVTDIRATRDEAKELFKRELNKMPREKILQFIYYRARKNYVKLGKTMNDEEFSAYMAALCDKFNIDAELVAVPTKNCKTLNDVLLSSELLFCIKHDNKFIYPPTRLSNVYDVDQRYEGRTGFATPLIDGVSKSDLVVKDITIPAAQPADCYNKALIRAKINTENFEEVIVREEESSSGSIKNQTSEVILDFEGILLEEDDEAMGKELDKKEDEEEKVKRRNKAKVEDRKRREKEGKQEISKDYLKNRKEEMDDNYDKVIKVDSFECIATGRLLDSRNNKMVVIKEYVLGEMIKKVGNSYALEIGELISYQLEIKDDEKERNADIFLEYARLIENEIHFTIPPGYKAEGVSNFNMNVDNDAGKFVSNAKIEGNEIVINTEKHYKKTTMTKAEWVKMIAFLDAAYNFTQKKIILKKI
jgi:hypothetical protein